MLELTRGARLLIGVVHLAATPGSPGYAGSMGPLLEGACADARALAEGGADALIVENFGDVPFHAERVPAETISALALALAAVRAEVGALPVGVNVLRNDARAGLGLCAAAGAAFLRVNVHAGAAVTDQGLLTGRAAETLRERARIAPDARLLADVQVKHAAPLAPRPLADEAEELWERAGADALVVSGRATGARTDLADLTAVRERLPNAILLVGSGADPQNAAALVGPADGVICGTALKRDGRVENPVDAARVARMRAALD